MRWCPPPHRLLLPPSPPLPPPSPRAGLSLPSTPLLPPRRLLLPLPLLWLLRHTPQSCWDGGAGPGDPPALACPPSDAQTCPPRAGGSPRSPASASARLPAAPAVTGKEAAGGARGVGGGREPGVGAQGAGGRASPPRHRFALGRLKSPLGLAVMGSRDRDWDTPPSRGTQGSYLTPGQGAPYLRVT